MTSMTRTSEHLVVFNIVTLTHPCKKGKCCYPHFLEEELRQSGRQRGFPKVTQGVCGKTGSSFESLRSQGHVLNTEFFFSVGMPLG